MREYNECDTRNWVSAMSERTDSRSRQIRELHRRQFVFRSILSYITCSELVVGIGGSQGRRYWCKWEQVSQRRASVALIAPAETDMKLVTFDLLPIWY